MISYDVVSCERACPMGKQTITRGGFSPFRSVASAGEITARRVHFGCTVEIQSTTFILKRMAFNGTHEK